MVLLQRIIVVLSVVCLVQVCMGTKIDILESIREIHNLYDLEVLYKSGSESSFQIGMFDQIDDHSVTMLLFHFKLKFKCNENIDSNRLVIDFYADDVYISLSFNCNYEMTFCIGDSFVNCSNHKASIFSIVDIFDGKMHTVQISFLFGYWQVAFDYQNNRLSRTTFLTIWPLSQKNFRAKLKMYGEDSSVQFAKFVLSAGIDIYNIGDNQDCAPPIHNFALGRSGYTHRMDKNNFTLTNFFGSYAPQGQKGERGPLGPPGFPGVKGDVGTKGSNGMRGAPGSIGLPGPKGERGIDGEQGASGFPGLDGSKGNIGMPGKQGIKGRDGMPGISSFGPKGDTGYCAPSDNTITRVEDFRAIILEVVKDYLTSEVENVNV